MNLSRKGKASFYVLSLFYQHISKFIGLLLLHKIDNILLLLSQFNHFIINLSVLLCMYSDSDKTLKLEGGLISTSSKHTATLLWLLRRIVPVLTVHAERIYQRLFTWGQLRREDFDYN